MRMKMRMRMTRRGRGERSERGCVAIGEVF